jgi:hypothetical protein
MIRSVFPSGGSRTHPLAVPGFYSMSIIQPVVPMLTDIAAGKYRTYRDLTLAGTR